MAGNKYFQLFQKATFRSKLSRKGKKRVPISSQKYVRCMVEL
jgi:hypothetical protein